MSVTPDFLIAGAAKCGTSSLAYNLSQHPDIFVWGGEIHYFTKYWDRGQQWYLSHFDTPAKVRGEKSPTYLYYPESHSRIHALLPGVKLIVMLRDPVARAFSNWNMRFHSKRLIRMGLEFNSRQPRALRLKSLDFEALVDYYLDHAGSEDPKIKALLFQQPLDIIHRGLYLQQIVSLLSYFKRENLLCLVSEHYFSREKEGYAKICQFLNVPEFTPKSFVKRRTGDYLSPIPASAASKLRQFYRPANETLFNFLGFHVSQWQDHAVK